MTLVGFRERAPLFVSVLSECHPVIPAISAAMPALSSLIDGMDGRRDSPQVAFIAGDATADHDGIALVFRHLQPLSAGDRAALIAFVPAHRFPLFLHPARVDSGPPPWLATPQRSFRLSSWDIAHTFQL